MTELRDPAALAEATMNVDHPGCLTPSLRDPPNDPRLKDCAVVSLCGRVRYGDQVWRKMGQCLDCISLDAEGERG